MQQENNRIQFNEGQQTVRVSKQSMLTRLVIRARLAKDEQGAQRVLLTLAVLSIIVALWVAFSTFWAPVSVPKVPVLPSGTPIPPTS